MKVLVIGAAGQLGRDVCGVFSDTELYRADLDGGGYRLDICDGGAVRRCIVEECRPDVVINTAAAHNVPQCESAPDLAFSVNATGARNVAVSCEALGSRLVHISTDYVFGQGHTRPILETELPAPLSVYGASKLAGEHLVAAECRSHYIVRTSALYGVSPCRAKGGKNFVQLMLHLSATRPEVRVVTDEVTVPTYTLSLARQIRLLVERGEPGLYHATSQGACSWHEFASAIFSLSGLSVRPQAATSAEFPSPVKRPSYSALDNGHARAQGLDIMPSWQEGLVSYLRESGLIA